MSRRLSLQRLARLLELVLGDLAACKTPAQDVNGEIAVLRPGERPDRKCVDADDAAPEEDHHGRHPAPAPAVVVTPHHFAQTSFWSWGKVMSGRHSRRAPFTLS